MTTKNVFVPPKLELIALLTSAFTIVTSIIYVTLSIVALVYSSQCNEIEEDIQHSTTWWRLIYHVYFINEDCQASLAVTAITKPHTVFVLVAVTLALSALTCIASVLLIVGVKKQEVFKYINAIVSVYVISWVVALAIDLTLASFFGMDYAYLTEQLDSIPEYLATIDQLRYGAFFLMSVVLKGYFGLFANGALICLLIGYLYKYNKASNMAQHSIHKLSAINAFQQSHPVENWPQHEFGAPLNRGRTNNAFIYEEDHIRTPARSDTYPTSSQSFNRSESWQHQSQNSSRPFSYIEEAKRSAKPSLPASPISPRQDPWRQEPWNQGPPIPVPDYSPHNPRRLKSALKPAS